MEDIIVIDGIFYMLRYEFTPSRKDKCNLYYEAIKHEVETFNNYWKKGLNYKADHAIVSLDLETSTVSVYTDRQISPVLIYSIQEITDEIGAKLEKEERA